MYVLSFFANNGIPATGLSPTIKIREVSTGNLLVNNLSMNEVGDGFYRYEFKAYDYTNDYAIICDGGNTLSDSDRYVICNNENYHQDIDNVINNNMKINRILGLLHENIYIDQTIYDSNNNLVSSRIRIYSDSDSVGSNSNVIASYLIYANCNEAGKFLTWSQIATAFNPGGEDVIFDYIVCSEDIDEGDYVNIWNDGGVAYIRKSTASMANYEAHGFVKESYLAGEIAMVHRISQLNNKLVGLNPAKKYYLSEDYGKITEIPPAGVGKILQLIGVSISDTEIVFNPSVPIILAG